MKKPRDIQSRIFYKIKKDLKTGCWNWTGSVFKKSNGNYGQLRMGGKNGSLKFAHRVSYEFYIGKVPDGLELDHLCRNTLCVNPAHLEPVTHAENMRRGYWTSKTKCIYGHDYEQNTYINIRGHRECVICRKNRATRFWKSKPRKSCPTCGKSITYYADYCRSCWQIGNKNSMWKAKINQL